MNAVRFHTTIGEDRVIRLPAEAVVASGQAEVIILQQHPETNENGSSARALVDKLAGMATELRVDTSDLPPDLACNHDRYLHGLPEENDGL